MAPRPRMRLFVYGSLMRGRAANRLLAGLPGAARVGRATLRARLYDLGEYPGAVLDDVADGEVFGELWVARYSRDALGALDRYEAYFPARPAESLFLRRRVRVRTPDASTTAWAYVLPRVPPHARPLPAGRWPQA